jgi:hypothetical protein
MPEGQIPEAVALDLLRIIAHSEQKAIGSGYGGARPDRTWVLDTYAECLACVKGVPGQKTRFA